MIDARFYDSFGPLSAETLAGDHKIGGEPSRLARAPAPAETSGPDDLCYLEGAKSALERSPAICVVAAAQAHLAPKAGALIFSDRPRATFARLAVRLAGPKRHRGDAAIHPDARIEAGARIEPGAVIGQGAQIGTGAEIGAYAVIGPGVTIGRRSRIGAGASIQCALIGDDVTILAGARIGEAGFGVAGDALGLVDVPHFGRAILQDRVSIGANSAVDRGMFGDTLIGEDTKIDNHCHIAHQVQVGRGVIMAAFAGISGSTIIGDGVMMGGRVGVGDHRKIGAGAVLAAGAIVLQDVPDGETWGGYPAKPLRKFLREVAWLGRKAGNRNGGE